MPMYEYECEHCGLFAVLRPISERGTPQFCPACESLSARTMRTAPFSKGLSPASRQAHAVNERAAHEPRRFTASSRSQGRNEARVRRGDSERSVRSSRGRPWMIGH